MKNRIKTTSSQNCDKKRVLYARVSSVEGQNLDRQLTDKNNYDLVIEDKISGAIDFFERPGGKKIEELKKKGVAFDLYVHSIDRLGRDLSSILTTLKWAESNSVNVVSITQGVTMFDPDGKPNPVGKLIVSILGSVAEMERAQIRERMLEGVNLAKLRGVYKGRRKGTQEDVVKFLTKPRNAKALELMKKGYKFKEAAVLAGVHVNTITKIRRLAKFNWNSQKE